MRILITSGGTKVDIDPVRHIMNMSKGTMGKSIAIEALNNGHEVHFLTSEDGKTPFKIGLDLNSIPIGVARGSLDDLIDFYQNYKDRYQEFSFRTYEDYREKMFALPRCFHYDAIIMCAAVSDYTADFQQNKVKSSSEMSIQLYPTEKIIDKMRSIAPKSKLVGFKLLNDSSPDALERVCQDYIKRKNLDMMVGNDLLAMRSGDYYQVHCTQDTSVIVKINFAYHIIQGISKL